MQILYQGDNEPKTIMELETLIRNFDQTGGWKFRHNEDDMRYELASRGWYEGLHDNGHYIVLNLDALELMPRPADYHKARD